MRGFASPGYATIGHFFGLWAAFNIFKNLFKYRVHVQDIHFIKCLKLAFLICIFAGLLTNVVQYLYFQFFDKGFFLSSLATMMETPEYKEMLKALFTNVSQSQLEQAFQQINIQTLMAQLVFMNLLMSVPVSFITAGLASFPRLEGKGIDTWE